MTPFVRPAAPDVLVENAAAWNEDWRQRREARSDASFHWHRTQGRDVHAEIVTALRSATRGHCSYCDGYPLHGHVIATIDHYRPKSLFPRLAFEWLNLYLACPVCQLKPAVFEYDTVLRPDEATYTFEQYFLYDFAIGLLQPSPAATPVDQQRAAATIEVFGFNRPGHPESRRTMVKLFSELLPSSRQDALDIFPYRFALLDALTL